MAVLLYAVLASGCSNARACAWRTWTSARGRFWSAGARGTAIGWPCSRRWRATGW